MIINKDGKFLEKRMFVFICLNPVNRSRDIQENVTKEVQI